MASVEHPLALNLEKHHAFSERVAWHTVVVINGVRTETKSESGQIISAESVGIGNACVWNGRKLILTAKHVVEGASPASLRFFVRHNRPIDWNTRPSHPIGEEAIAFEIETIIRSSSEDLACIVLSAEETGKHLEFVELPQDFGGIPPEGSGTLLIGSPADKAVAVAEHQDSSGNRWRSLAVQPRGCWAVVAGDPPRFFPSSFDPSRHFLLRYDPIEEGALPFGFSGSGVWYRRGKPDSIWVADPVLAGIQVSWHRESKLMIAIRSDVVRQFLESDVAYFSGKHCLSTN